MVWISITNWLQNSTVPLLYFFRIRKEIFKKMIENNFSNIGDV